MTIYARLKNYTMVNQQTFETNIAIACKKLPAGNIVECGTWRGGMIAGIAMLRGPDRHYVLLDSFQGLPHAQNIDGEEALKWQADKTGPTYYNNCVASEADARTAMDFAGVNYTILSGWFKDTLPSVTGPIALLRLDADWYESTKLCLEQLFDLVAPGGIIIIDDYYVWTGCSRAVHEFLGTRCAAEQIRSLNDVAYMVKVEAVEACVFL